MEYVTNDFVERYVLGERLGVGQRIIAAGPFRMMGRIVSVVRDSDLLILLSLGIQWDNRGAPDYYEGESLDALISYLRTWSSNGT